MTPTIIALIATHVAAFAAGALGGFGVKVKADYDTVKAEALRDIASAKKDAAAVATDFKK